MWFLKKLYLRADKQSDKSAYSIKYTEEDGETS